MRFQHRRPTSVRPGLVCLLGLTAALAACADTPGRERLTTAPEPGAAALHAVPPRLTLPPRDSVPAPGIPPLRETATVTGTVRVRIEALGAPAGAARVREFRAVRVAGTVGHGVAIARGAVADPSSGRPLPSSVRIAERAGRLGSHQAMPHVVHDA